MTTIQPAVPICEKAALTLEEAAAFSNIGINKLREITNERNCDFVFCREQTFDQAQAL